MSIGSSRRLREGGVPREIECNRRRSVENVDVEHHAQRDHRHFVLARANVDGYLTIQTYDCKAAP